MHLEVKNFEWKGVLKDFGRGLSLVWGRNFKNFLSPQLCENFVCVG
jgi:hypothetical protein